MHDFTDSVSQISRNFNTTRRSVSQWKQNFENFPVIGSFFDTNLKKFELFRLANSGYHSSAVIIDRRKFITI